MFDLWRRKKIWWIIATCFLLIAGFGAYKNFFASNFSKERSVVINGKKITVELALTPQEREQGLSDRGELCAQCGMLFIFEKKDNYQFWMKDMRFALDMVWINGAKVVQIDKDVPFLGGTDVRRSPKVAVDKVLEINAGESDRLGIKEVDEIKF